MIINIDENLVDVLGKLATADNITPELYVERKINATLTSLFKQSIVNKIENKKVADIKTIDVEVTKIDEAVKVRDYVEPVLPEEAPVEEPIEGDGVTP